MKNRMKERFIWMCLTAMVLLSTGCEEECICTKIYCPPGVYVVVNQANGAPFQDGNWQLNWNSREDSGTVNFGPWNPENETIETLFFEIEAVEEGTAWIQLALTVNDETVATQLFRNLQWQTRTCNDCTGGCESLVTNARVSFEIPAIEQDTAAQ